MENDLKDMEGLDELEHMVHVSTVDLEEKLDILLGKKVSKNGRFKMKEKISKQEKVFLKELKAAHKPGHFGDWYDDNELLAQLHDEVDFDYEEFPTVEVSPYETKSGNPECVRLPLEWKVKFIGDEIDRIQEELEEENDAKTIVDLKNELDKRLIEMNKFSKYQD